MNRELLTNHLYRKIKLKRIDKKSIVTLLFFIVLVIISTLCFTGCSKNELNVTTGREETVYKSEFSDNPDMIVEATKSVVKINCYNDEGIIKSSGSGFSVFENGVIVTNYHVIKDHPARIEIVTETGQKCDIQGGIGVSAERDIAILYYQHRNSDIDIPTLPIGDSTRLKKGEKVIAIGSPLGLTNIVSAGVFSSYTNIGDVTDIQFTASISNGSSGGALFNDNGEVIGITCASIENGQNLNLAVPIDFVKSLWESEALSKQELSMFYEAMVPRYSIEYVLNNYNYLQSSIFYLECEISGYESSDNQIIVYCTNNQNKNLKAVYYRNTADYWGNQMIEDIIKNKKTTEIKCMGVIWSDAENIPYAILCT